MFSYESWIDGGALMEPKRFIGKHFHFSYERSPEPIKEQLYLHAHDVYEVYLFLDGRGTYVVEGSEYPLLPGTVLIMRAAEMHKPNMLSGSPYERATIHFSPEFLNPFDPEHRLLRPFTERALGRENLYRRAHLRSNLLLDSFSTMCSLSADSYEENIRFTNLFLCILGEIADAWQRRGALQSGDAEHRMVQITHYIEENLGEDLSLALLQKRFYISKSQLTRLFKEATGLGVWEYICLKRLTLARTRLREGMHAGDVAACCGYKDYSAFYRAYRKRFGAAPTELERVE